MGCSLFFWPPSHFCRYQLGFPAENFSLSYQIIWPQPSDNLATEPIFQITYKQVSDTNWFMWLMLSEKALCKQFLWLKPIIICQLQHTMQRGTSVPHFCHLSHITMACVTHSQICKGWQVWLWSWEYECIAGNLFMKRDYEKKKEKNAAQWEQISRMNQLHRHRWGWITIGKDIWVIMDHKWWEKTKPASVNPSARLETALWRRKMWTKQEESRGKQQSP